jgi:hypothetical protein
MKSSQKVLSICGNSFKTVGKAFLMKLIERIPKGGYIEESKSKIYLDLFGYYTIPSVISQF